jgi:hypothetical protein
VLNGKDGKVLWTWRGAAAGDRLGAAVAGIGDVDRDGFADVAIGAPLADVGGADAGLVRVLSGRTGQTLWQRSGPAAGDALGWSLAAAGDADGDGWIDLAVGSRRAGALPGFALLVSGKDGSNLHRFDGTTADDRFGVCVAAAGDANRDGRPDVAVLAARGQLHLHSGRDGTLLRAWSELPRAEAASACMAGVGDIDGDGHDDLAVGTPLGGFPISGVVRVWSGRDGSPLQMLLGTAAGLDHGWSVAGGDVNGDRRPDIVMSEPRTTATGGGQVQVVSGTPLLLSADRHELSLSAATGPRQQTWTFDAGSSRAGAFYLAIGTLSGPKPGVLLPGGILVPINPDAWTDLTLIFPNGPMLVASIGMLDAKGQGAGAFRLVPGLPSWLAGTVFWHAYVVFAPGRWLAASNAVPITLLR